ncbi:hypothetical protein [Rubrivivax gelatinosus]|nr:hypothetical protein [Rubrivivax gelatinosus]
MSTLSEERRYELTHCRLCEAPAIHMRRLYPDAKELPEGELGYPAVIIENQTNRSTPSTIETTPRESHLTIEVTVIANLFDEIEQARANDDTGRQYVITPETPGVDVRSLREGQRLRCTILNTRLPKIIRATVIE